MAVASPGSPPESGRFTEIAASDVAEVVVGEFAGVELARPGRVKVTLHKVVLIQEAGTTHIKDAGIDWAVPASTQARRNAELVDLIGPAGGFARLVPEAGATDLWMLAQGEA